MAVLDVQDDESEWQHDCVIVVLGNATLQLVIKQS